jgi:hypothetical protein
MVEFEGRLREGLAEDVSQGRITVAQALEIFVHEGFVHGFRAIVSDPQFDADELGRILQPSKVNILCPCE